MGEVLEHHNAHVQWVTGGGTGRRPLIKGTKGGRIQREAVSCNDDTLGTSIVENEFDRSDSKGRLLDSVHDMGNGSNDHLSCTRKSKSMARR